MPDAVVLTRRPDDNAALAAELRGRGLDVIELPCIRTEPLADRSELEREITALRPGDVLVLTSATGAEAVSALGVAVRCSVAAVGPATASRARHAGMNVTFVAPEHTAPALGRMLPIPSGHVVLARADRADGDLPEILRQRGATVRTVVAYRTVAEISGDLTIGRAALARDPVVVVASPSAVHALRDAFGSPALRRARFVSIGRRTAEAVKDLIGADSAVAADVDVASIANAVTASAQEVIA